MVDREETPLPRKQNNKNARKAKPAKPALAPAAATVSDGEGSESSPGKATPSSDSQDDFELLETSMGSLKATGTSHNKVKANKRKGKKK